MTTNLLRNLSVHARRLRLSPFNPSPSLLSLSFSSRTDSPIPISQQKSLDVEDISNEEFKRRVAKLQEGDAEAIPSVFEAILQRSLSGKPIEADEELMREVLGKGTGSEEDDDDDDYDDDDVEEDEFDSDFKGMSDTDYEDEEDSDLDIKPRIRADEKKTKPVFGTTVSKQPLRDE